MAENSIHIEYNHDLKALEKLLKEVKRPGDFSVSGTVEIPMPKVEVDGAGFLSFPVPSAQIAALIQIATRAPYGRGEETILDESVRKVWQLPPDKVHVTGKSWEANFNQILQNVIQGLGCAGMAVSAELYKMLVYDTGGFFLSHRDTEKAAGMFGTLVLALPSDHRGGELVIRHAGREVTVAMSGAEFSEVSYAAFYADCEHEVRPIASGNRVCLVYNLIQQRGTGKQQSIEAPDYGKQIAAAANALEKYLTDPGASAKIAWLLEHQYSPEGLSFAGLKYADAARAQVLVQAAERAGCAAHLGIVHIEESGAAEPSYHDYRPRRWGHRYDEDEEEESESENTSDFEVIEVCDGRNYIAQWRDVRDKPVDFGEIPVEEGELLPAGALDGEKPDEQRLMEASGNEGASFERSYHRAALVLWRKERYAEVLLQAGVAAALPYLEECIEKSESKGAPVTARDEAVALARRMVKEWAEAAEFSNCRGPGSSDKRRNMLRLLNRLGDVSLLRDFIAGVVTHDFDGSENAVLAASIKKLGATDAGPLGVELNSQQMKHFPAECVDLLERLAPLCANKGKEAWSPVLRQIAEALVGKLEEVGKKAKDDEWMFASQEQKPHPINAAFISGLLNLLGELDLPELRVAATQKFAARPAVFDPVTVLVPAIESIEPKDAASARLWEHCVEFLLKRSEFPPEAPKDWRQSVKLSCTCADCRELQKFALDPVEQTHRFRVRKDRRQHLHGMIDRNGLDMTHVTERVGSPQTLVCTKDRRSYKRRCDEYRKEIAALAELEKVATKSTVGIQPVLDRIAAARGRANTWTP